MAPNEAKGINKSWLRKCKVLIKTLSVGKANYVIQSKLLEMDKYVTVDNMDVFE